MKDVSIVIVNYKMKDNIEVCLSSLYAELVKSSLSVQITVVDNNSGDGIKAFLQKRFPNVHCIELSENKGFGFAQNAGLSAHEAQYYFALNPDTEFLTGESVIEGLYQFMQENPRIGMIGPRLQYPDGGLQFSCWRFPPLLQPLYQRTRLGQTDHGKQRVAFHHMKEIDHSKVRPVDALMGSAMFVRADAMKQVGMFDDRFFMYYEDIDWCRRMWDAGWPVYYVPTVTLVHIHGRGSAKVPGVFRALFKNKLARIHVKSWFKYLWKWRGQHHYYSL
ncbi:MAG: glycosyltransferase family 2 protein [Candidatus Magasanikbacteria bacterium]|jgi:GT2 family glycosyltransferase|nr:glycosyltransferase family 2 protein [Candidatus Magasanikbacteria bacterium]